MKTLTKTPNQLSGILDVLAIPVSKIEELTSNTVQVDSNEVYHFKPSNDSGQYTRNQQKSNAGISYLQLVNLFIQGHDAGKTLNLAEAVNHEFVLFIQNEDGSWSRIGSLEEPFQITVDVQTESPGLNIRFTAETLSTIFPLTSHPFPAIDLIADETIIIPPAS